MVIARLSWLRWSYVFILLSAVEGWGIRKLVIFSLEARNNAPASSLHPSNDRTTFKESKFRLMTVNHDVIPQSSAALSRRLMKSLQSVLAIGLLVPAQALATRGAFEMDADFYFQNLFGVRKGKDPSFLKNGVIFPTPRRLDPVFASNIATIVFEELSRATNVQIEIFRNNVYGKVPYYLKYFCTFAPIVSESLDDQYYFDMIMYIAYLEAGRIVKQSEERVKLRQRIGDRILEYVSSSGEFVAPTATPNSTKAALAANLVNKRGNIKLLLNIFVAAKFISGYKYDDEPLDDIPYVLSSFNEVDRQLPIY